jgi:hypothetical protein
LVAARTGSGFATTLTAIALATIGAGCGGGSGGKSASSEQYGFSTTRLCALVPARDPAAAAFPPQPPVRVFGTDLGWTYERDGIITILFGDSWQRIDICPLQANDDSLGTLAMPPTDWPGFEATASLPDDQCPTVTFAVDQAGTAFAPIELQRWDGEPVPLGPLNTPVTGFYDGQREWAVFIVGGGQPCTSEESNAGAPCPSTLSPQGADLTCGFVSGNPQCLDPTSSKGDPGDQAYYLHFAERVGPSQYITRAMFLTNKYLNLTARTVAAFEENGRHDYRPGSGALLMWGRPGFNDQDGDGQAPPFFMYHRLPLEVVAGQLAFAPRYLTGLHDGIPTFGDSQRTAVPLYGNEFEPVNHAAVSWIAPLRRWLMIYGGSVIDPDDPGDIAGLSQPVRHAMHARVATDPWGPWTDPQPVLTQEQVAEDLVCGRRQFAGCLPSPSPRIRPGCVEFVDPTGGGHLYGANIIDSHTRPRGRGADVFWEVSTWHPYSVVLIKTRVTPE